jgi:AcrR family transcriptional regulator
VPRPETHARILAAARELIPGAGVSLPVTQIARHAGVAIQTIYDQFGSKGGLLVAVVADVQASFGLFERFREVFQSPDGEAAMRRMNEATVSFWAQAWPYLEFMLRSRRVDPVVGREMSYVDELRHAHYWAITRRLEQEGRLRDGMTADAAADVAFALTTPTVYEELAVRRSRSTAEATDAITDAVLGGILTPGRSTRHVDPPDWPALEAAAAARAIQRGADPARLSPTWAATRPDASA